MPSPPVPWDAERVRFSAGSAALIAGALAATLLARNLFLAAHQPLGWAVAAITVALVLGPITSLLGRFVRRGLAIGLSMLALLAVVSVVLVGVVAELQQEAERLREVLPDAAAQLERHETFGSAARDLELADRVERAVDDLDDRISAQAALEGAVGTAPSFALTGILVVFFLLWGGRMAEGAARQISDDEQRERLAEIAVDAVHRGRTYVVAVVGQAVVLGAVAGGIAWWHGLPAPIALGLGVGVLSLVPYLGVALGSVPVLLLAAASEPGWRTALIALLFVALQVAAVLIARHLIHPRSLRVGPAAIVITALLGFEVYGFGGAAVATTLVVFALAAMVAAGARAGASDPQPAAA